MARELAAARAVPPVRTRSSSAAPSPRTSSAAGAVCSRSPTTAAAEVWIDALVTAHKEGRLGVLQLQRIDDGPARQSPLAPALRAAGFVDGYRGLTLRA